ncbi:MAG: protein-tyrosine-phosphatase [Bacteroidota bacterium]|nr:protein-tyrosine-phosphatase [Bacteroidota bacterium]
MNEKISKVIGSFTWEQILDERKNVLQGLVAYIQSKKDLGETIRLNFICTHNSRRSHLSQIWAQTMAYQFGIKNVYCYSGGTEATAMFPKVAETLIHQGFHIEKLSETDNPVYAVKFAQNEHPIICFSKAYQHEFNPKNNFAAIVTCNNADEACPIVFGAEARIPVKYNDPKAFDNTPQQTEKYAERSLEIAQEMAWVFSQITI